MSPFRKGMESLQESADRSLLIGSRRFFRWAPGEEKTIRFLTDGEDIILARVHEYVTCFDGSKRSFVCRRQLDEECELCKSDDEKASKWRELGYGVAVWREPRRKDGRIVFGTKLEEVEVEKDGAIVREMQPWVGIIAKAPRNFWSWFNGAYQTKGTLLDRDYTIKRVGSGMDTVYQAFPEDPQPLDLEKFAPFVPNLEEMLLGMGSKEYYDRWLHGDPDDGSSTKSVGKSEVSFDDDDLELIKKANLEIAKEAISGTLDDQGGVADGGNGADGSIYD